MPRRDRSAYSCPPTTSEVFASNRHGPDPTGLYTELVCEDPQLAFRQNRSVGRNAPIALRLTQAADRFEVEPEPREVTLDGRFEPRPGVRRMPANAAALGGLVDRCSLLASTT